MDQNKIEAWCECGHHQNWHREGVGECSWVWESYGAEVIRPCESSCSSFAIQDMWLPSVEV